MLTIKPFDSCFGSRWVIVRYRGISFWLAGFFVNVEVYHRLPGPLVHLAGHQNVMASHTALHAEGGFSSLFRFHLRQQASEVSLTLATPRQKKGPSGLLRVTATPQISKQMRNWPQTALPGPTASPTSTCRCKN